MFQEEKMLKDKEFMPGRNMEVPTRDGRSSMLMKLRRLLRRELTRNSVSMSTDHSTSSQDFQ